MRVIILLACAGALEAQNVKPTSSSGSYKPTPTAMQFVAWEQGYSPWLKLSPCCEDRKTTITFVNGERLYVTSKGMMIPDRKAVESVNRWWNFVLELSKAIL